MDATFGPREAAAWIAVPGPEDDKYSRGVLGLATGSARYPGAAVLGVEAAMHTGVGMIRYLGVGRPTRLVLQRRPEAVTEPGRVQAWVVGSGQDPDELDARSAAIRDRALADPVPIVIDAGALSLADRAVGTRVLVPHTGELARLLGRERDDVNADPAGAVREAAVQLGAVVLLKGHTTRVADPAGSVLEVSEAPNWTATAGAGDALAGVLGALLATHALELEADPGAAVPIAATAAVLHGRAAARASRGGPFTVLGLCAQLPEVVRELAGA
ncbi:ADP/ATP-dependent (S)-NAD(P)H-hydrate dehydratase [Homoserinibacter sp. GY 40078]|uniref:ADP-dependent NAD(P)H-hydrate dehydratase n=1 Tax=Homoserinibacter sp. GY 40078 TaxID=2603275 RepID=UPI0011CBD89A|nr:ADP/ATP-dependent (S)-NAD(P)H-hydrate dehydratase [Homoserinibacter sp. GY 40078]TXK17211.1 NAD(P)H-hydrate dehydratase [Homoserinibacter sp. GY 40078]